MSKIVTLRAQVPWISQEHALEQAKKAVSALETAYSEKFNIKIRPDSNLQICSSQGLASVVLFQDPETGNINCRYDTVRRQMAQVVMNEVILESIKERAVRHNYRITVNREHEKVCVLLEK